MNLLFLSQVFPDDDAPVCGTFNLSLCRAIAERHSVRVIAPRPWTETVRRRLRGRGRFRGESLGVGSSLSATYPTFWYVPRFRLERSGAAMTRSIRKAIDAITQDWQPEAVLSYWAHPDGRAGIEIAKKFDVPSACIVGGSDVLLLPKQSFRRREAIVSVLKENDRIFTVSEGLRRRCIELGAEADRVHTTYQGINPSRFSPGSQAEARKKLKLPLEMPTFVWVGRMVDVKGLDVLLDAVRLRHLQGDRLRLHLLGDGPLRGRLEQLALDYSLRNVVEFHGAVSSDALADWYRAADATVLSSRSEGLPNVLRESLACGTPFVSTDVGSIREIADPAYSQLVPTNEPDAMAAALGTIRHSDFRLAASLHRPRTWAECAADMLAILRPEPSVQFPYNEFFHTTASL